MVEKFKKVNSLCLYDSTPIIEASISVYVFKTAKSTRVVCASLLLSLKRLSVFCKSTPAVLTSQPFNVEVIVRVYLTNLQSQLALLVQINS